MAGTVIAVPKRAGRCQLLSAMSTRERLPRKRSFWQRPRSDQPAAAGDEDQYGVGHADCARPVFRFESRSSQRTIRSGRPLTA